MGGEPLPLRLLLGLDRWLLLCCGIVMAGLWVDTLSRSGCYVVGGIRVRREAQDGGVMSPPFEAASASASASASRWGVWFGLFVECSSCVGFVVDRLYDLALVGGIEA